MRIVRKLVKVGGSKAVTIPPDWINYYERLLNKPVTEVVLEVNGVIVLYVDGVPRIK